MRLFPIGPGGTAVGLIVLAASMILPETAVAATLKETRSEAELFGGSLRFKLNTFTFELPDLASQVLGVEFSWKNLDADYDTEGFDVLFKDQNGAVYRILDEGRSNVAGGTIYNSSGSYTGNLPLRSLARGVVSFYVFTDGDMSLAEDVNPYGSGPDGTGQLDGSMTFALRFSAAPQVPTPLLLPGFIGMAIALLRQPRQ